MRAGVLAGKYRELPSTNKALLVLINKELGFEIAAGLFLYMVEPEHHSDFPQILKPREREILDAFIETTSARVRLPIAA